MATFTTTASSSESLNLPGAAMAAVTGRSAATGSREEAQLLARLTGFLFLLTYATSIPPFLRFYVPALSDPAFILGGGFDRSVSWGALLELLLIVANIGTALTLYPVLKKHSEVLSQGYVTARLTESGFIAVGIVALLALNTLRAQAGGGDQALLVVAGRALVAIHDWTFRLGPGFIVGIGNGLILGYLMWKTRLVPRALSMLGLVGGPALLVAGIAVLFGEIEAGSTAQVLLTAPEFFWELSLGLWLLAKGFDAAALEALDRT